MSRPVPHASVQDCVLIDLPKMTDPRGNLTFIEGGGHVPFEIRRVFYVYDVPTGTNRGAHAHRSLHQFIVCLSGSLDVRVDDGEAEETIHINRPWRGLHIPPMIWASEVNFDPGSIYLVLASDHYDEADYIRDYDNFLHAVRD
ncbi:FdtA/QdtA family cupin domain-containing protein [Rubrivirga sp. S365]|uniref:FdtA/QdtA family cupin domain-containing protein n=1 Tax=Rubrivirga litoralis TaxID=3075598 RepID=A0ABU3BR98_9BACT|nr:MULTISPECIES: FdtA/QdtA family cupin domain-containing protein [unclassified Rubrivirga]MDT0631816.1 FdtA/QdtA family cupin domain-containing protein [Rubrivirga sp. F394]MDT7856492.1 FdtA/QdtA family cupin domain-containing protein [Rubrivirga sp. S365]